MSGEEPRGGVVGYTSGVFDMFHIGHLNILRNASRHCDRLVVSVTTDELALARKGKTPIVPWSERAEIVASCRYVDEVVPQSTMDKLAAWEEIRFDVIFVGDDWRGSKSWNELERRFGEVGVRVHYFPYTKHTSSTVLRDRIFGT